MSLRHGPFGVKLWSSIVTTTTVAFTWSAVAEATSYVLKIGTSSMQANGDTHNTNVGNTLAHDVVLSTGTYYARTVVVGGAHDGELTAGGEQVVTI